MPNASDQLSDHRGMACDTPSTTDKRAGRRLTEKVKVLIVVLLDNLDADDDVERPPEDFDGRNINRLGRDDADSLKLDLGRGGRARVEVAEGGDQGERAGQVGVVGEQGADRVLCGHGGVGGVGGSGEQSPRRAETEREKERRARRPRGRRKVATGDPGAVAPREQAPSAAASAANALTKRSPQFPTALPQTTLPLYAYASVTTSPPLPMVL
jgi:hypothetical protein